ncbi:MAG TPA: hypothetical protein VN874_04570 [Myxococcales bacterium]|nr:hypothetical protein [Myxococcales bacterium]
MDPEPLGAYLPRTSTAVAFASAALATVTAALLLELSHTLAERARGRWYAGNGRDVFHVAAALALAVALFVAGHPPALCGFAAAAVCAPSLLALDGLPARRRTRVGLLLAIFALGMAAPVLAPRQVVDGANALARAAFPPRR